MPEVSIIINCFNEAAYLRETLDSVTAQTFPDWEVCFFDNGSSDGSGDIAAGYGEKVICQRSETTLSLGQARSKAYQMASGKYIALLDADDVWMPEKLEKQVQLFRSNPNLGMAFCDSIYFDSTGDRYRLFTLTPPHRGQIFGQLLTANFIFSSAMMFSQEALKQLGCAFDERYTRVADYDLTLRMAYQYPADYVDETLCKWRINDWTDKAWKKNLVPRVVELNLAMDNLLAQFPGIQKHYGNELNGFYKMLAYQEGMTAWHDGKAAEARGHFAPYRSAKKFAFAYLCTLLMPYGFFYRAKNVYRNTVTNRRSLKS